MKALRSTANDWFHNMPVRLRKICAGLRRWVHKPVPVSAVLILYVATIVGLGYTHDQAKRVERQSQRVALLAQASCPNRQDARAASRTVALTVRTIVATTGQPVDYTQVIGYEDVEPAMKTFLANLSALSSGAGGFRDVALASLDAALSDLPPIVCPK